MRIENLFKKIKINSQGENKPNKKHSAKVYEIYQYMKKNAVGYSKRVKSSILMKEFNIEDNKTFRSIIEEIRQSEELQKIICSEAGKSGGYWIATNENEIKDTLDHLYKRSMEMLKTYSAIRNKARLNGQYRFRIRPYEKIIIESVMENEKEK